MKTKNDFIWQVPGEDAEIDAYNLILASLTHHDLWFESVIDHQIDMKHMGEVLAVVTAWLELAYRDMNPEDREMTLAYYRALASQNALEKR